MVFHSLIYCVISISFLQISSGTILNRVTRDAGTDLKCEELEKPDWSIGSLKDIVLDSWPWKCLDLQYNEITLRDNISKICPDVFEAAKKGSIGFFQYYVEKAGVDLKAFDDDGETALHHASQNGHLHIVKYIASKVDADTLNVDNDKSLFLTPLMSAVSHGQLEIAKYFIDEMKVDSSYDRDAKTKLVLYAAHGGNLALIKYLIEDKNYTFSNDDQRLLYRLAAIGNPDTIKYFIDEKNLTKITTNFEGSPLHVAAQHGNLQAVKLFVEHFHNEVDRKNLMEETPAFKAAEGGSLPVLRYLIDEKGADLNVKNNKGARLIHPAAYYGYLDVVKYLVDEKGMSVELKDNDGRTPLHRAVSANKINIVKYLADEKMADLTAKDKFKRNLLHKAAYAGNICQMKYLVDDKKMTSQINQKDENDYTPAMVAAARGEMEVLKFLLDERKANMMARDKKGYNMLHIAVRENQSEVVKYLIELKSFDVESSTFNGATALDLASRPRSKTGVFLQEYLLEKTRESFMRGYHH